MNYRINLQNETTERTITRDAGSPKCWEDAKRTARLAEESGYTVQVWLHWGDGSATRCDLND